MISVAKPPNGLSSFSMANYKCITKAWLVRTGFRLTISGLRATGQIAFIRSSISFQRFSHSHSDLLVVFQVDSRRFLQFFRYLSQNIVMQPRFAVLDSQSGGKAPLG